MDEDVATALYHQLMTRDPEALVVEVITLRSWCDALTTAMDNLHAHIQGHGNEATDPLAIARCAGGMAAVQLLRDWSIEGMGTINDFITTMGAVD